MDTSTALDFFHDHSHSVLVNQTQAQCLDAQYYRLPKRPQSKKTIDFGETTTNTRIAKSSVTQLILTQNVRQQLPLILPMITSLSSGKQNKWITWIDMPSDINKTTLDCFGIDTKKFQTVYSSKRHDAFNLSVMALKTGRSQLVIASPGKLSDAEFQQLEFAAIKGNCPGIIITER